MTTFLQKLASKDVRCVHTQKNVFLSLARRWHYVIVKPMYRDQLSTTLRCLLCAVVLLLCEGTVSYRQL